VPHEYQFQQHIEDDETESDSADRLYHQRIERETDATQQQDWSFPHALWIVNGVLAVTLLVGVGVLGGTPVLEEPTPAQPQQQKTVRIEDEMYMQYMQDQSQGFFFF